MVFLLKKDFRRNVKFKDYIGDVCFKYFYKSYKGMISDMIKIIKVNYYV